MTGQQADFTFDSPVNSPSVMNALNLEEPSMTSPRSTPFAASFSSFTSQCPFGNLNDIAWGEPLSSDLVMGPGFTGTDYQNQWPQQPDFFPQSPKRRRCENESGTRLADSCDARAWDPTVFSTSFYESALPSPMQQDQTWTGQQWFPC